MTGWFIAADCMKNGHSSKNNIWPHAVFMPCAHLCLWMIVSGLYNTVYFCLRWKYKERKHVDRYLYCSCASLRECEVWRDAVALWVTVSVTVCNGKCRWCDVKGSRDLPVGHLKSNEVSTGHRLWRSTLLSNPPACHPESKKKKKQRNTKPPETHSEIPPKLDLFTRQAVNVPWTCECATEKWEEVLWALQLII